VPVTKPVQVIHRLDGRSLIVDLHARNASCGTNPRAFTTGAGLMQSILTITSTPLESFPAKERSGRLPPGCQHLRVSLFASLVVCVSAEGARRSLAVSGLFNALKDQLRRASGDVGHRHEQPPRAQHPQVLCGRRSASTKTLTAAITLRRVAGATTAALRQHARHRRRGHTSGPGDIVDFCHGTDDTDSNVQPQPPSRLEVEVGAWKLERWACGGATPQKTS